MTKALGLSMDDLQASFDRALDARFSRVQAALRDQKDAAPRVRRGSMVLRAAAAARPGSFQAQLALGQALAAQGDRAAFGPLEKAAALVPMAIGENSPHALMGRLAEQLGDRYPGRSRIIARCLAQDPHRRSNPPDGSRRWPQQRATSRRALAQARVVAIDPFDSQGHPGSAAWRSSARTRQWRPRVPDGAGRGSARSRRRTLRPRRELPAGRPGGRCEAEALAALEIAPSFERAQDLLLKTVDGKGEPEVRR